MAVAVVGSGPSGVAAARALLERGLEVELIDVGAEPEAASRELAAEIRGRGVRPPPAGRDLLLRLKRGEEAGGAGVLDGLRTLLGGGVGAERVAKRILGSTFAFDGVDEGIPIENVSVPRSLAFGGLSNVWGASCYPLRTEDYAAWPLDPAELTAYYPPAAELLGLVQHRDDLARAYPLEGETQPERPRSPGSPVERCLERWRAHEGSLGARGMAVGRTRLAVREAGGAEDACRECGLCFYGCAFGAIYNGRRTVSALRAHPRFRYAAGRLVTSFREEAGGVRLRWRRGATGAVEEEGYDALFLAAGTLSSLRIAADSLEAWQHPAQLLDNDMYLLPLLGTAGRVPGHHRPAFTLGEGVIAVDPGVVAPHPVHLQLYAFQEFFLAEVGPVLAALPAALQRPAWALLNNVLVAYVYLHGNDSLVGTARVRPPEGDGVGRIRLDWRPHVDGRGVVRRLVRLLWRARRELGFVPLPFLTKSTPIGFSGHLAGTLPMRSEPGYLESDPRGRLQGTERVFVVDCAALPSLPAQNPTFTSMANAMRVVAAWCASDRVDQALAGAPVSARAGGATA